MQPKLNLTSYTVSTSSALQQLQSLDNLLKQRPRITTGEASLQWDKISAVINQTKTPLISGITSTINSQIKGAVSTITAPINADVSQNSNIVANVANSIIDDVIGRINDLLDWIGGIWDTITEWFDDLINEIVTIVGNVYNWIANIIGTARDWIVNAVTDAIDAVSTWLDNVVTDVSDWITTAYNNVKDWLTNTINNVGDWLRNTYQNISDWIGGAIQTLTNAYQTVKTTIEDWFANLIDWFKRTKDNIVEWWHNLLHWVADFISEKIIPTVMTLTEGANKVVELAQGVWAAISDGDYQKAFDLLDNVFTGAGLPAPIQGIRAVVSTLAYFWQTVNLQFVPMQYNAQKQAQINLALEPLDLGTSTQAVFRGLMSQADFTRNASLGGISKQRSGVVIDASRPLPSAGQIQQAFLRGEIDLETHDHMLSQYGLSKDNIELIKQLYLIIPGVNDIIRMAVREAFTPEIAETFGQYQDFPPEFATWAGKQGLSEDWAKRYWASHWELPSATMGFEMLHRGVIDQEELTLLLRALDVMPYWRERLIQISYNPLTRVDVRRMYQLGVIDVEQVRRSYLDLGYNEQHAAWLTEFTIRYYTPEDQNQQDEFKALARSVYSQAYKRHVISEDEYRQFLTDMHFYIDDVNLLIQIDNYSIEQSEKLFDYDGYRKDWQKMILSAYDRGLLHRNEVTPMLLDLGYDENEATMELDLADYNRVLAIRNMVANQVHDQYTEFIIDNVEMHVLLDQFNFTPEEIDRLQEEWDIERALRTKRPSLTDLKNFYNKGLLTLEQLLDELRGLGYNEKYIPMYAEILG